MFDKLRDLNNLRKQAAEMERLLVAEQITGVSKDGVVTIIMNGKHDLLNVVVAEGIALEKTTVEQDIKEAYTDAQGKLQKVLLEKFKGMM